MIFCKYYFLISRFLFGDRLLESVVVMAFARAREFLGIRLLRIKPAEQYCARSVFHVLVGVFVVFFECIVSFEYGYLFRGCIFFFVE